MIRVYTASKLTTAPTWKLLQEQWPFVFFHARWLRHVAIGTPDTAEHAVRFWVEDQEDVETADVVLVYAASAAEKLRGALVEAGIALAKGIPVIVVGEHVDYGTWHYHPLVLQVRDLEQASAVLKAMAKMVGKRHARNPNGCQHPQ